MHLKLLTIKYQLCFQRDRVFTSWCDGS